MKNEVLYMLLDDYADHESVFLAGAISNDAVAKRQHPKYINKVVAPSLEPVTSHVVVFTSCPTIHSTPYPMIMQPWC